MTSDSKGMFGFLEEPLRKEVTDDQYRAVRRQTQEAAPDTGRARESARRGAYRGGVSAGRTHLAGVPARRDWTPAVTVLTFLRQVLHGNCSCRQAVAMTLAQALSQQLAQGGGPSDSMSGEPGAYSQARQHLPRSVSEEVNAWAIGSWNRSRRAGMPCPTAPTAKNLGPSNAATKSFRTSNTPEKLPE